MIKLAQHPYKSLFTMFFGKRKKPHETFHILKMKAPFEKKSHFENENSLTYVVVVI
jgi:hypothetical protein